MDPHRGRTMYFGLAFAPQSLQPQGPLNWGSRKSPGLLVEHEVTDTVQLMTNMYMHSQRMVAVPYYSRSMLELGPSCRRFKLEGSQGTLGKARLATHFAATRAILSLDTLVKSLHSCQEPICGAALTKAGQKHITRSLPSRTARANFFCSRRRFGGHPTETEMRNGGLFSFKIPLMGTSMLPRTNPVFQKFWRR
jgi:hypothetical protein